MEFNDDEISTDSILNALEESQAQYGSTFTIIPGKEKIHETTNVDYNRKKITVLEDIVIYTPGNMLSDVTNSSSFLEPFNLPSCEPENRKICTLTELQTVPTLHSQTPSMDVDAVDHSTQYSFVETENEENAPIISADNANPSIILPINPILPNIKNKSERRRRAQPEEWEKNLTKMKRMKGEKYSGYSRCAKTKQITKGIERNERKMKSSCESSFCEKSKKRFCSSFSQADREALFKNFWNELDWEGKKQFVNSLLDKAEPKQRKVDVSTSRRSESLLYHLKLNEERKQVCKKMFLNTLGLNETMLYEWMKNVKQGISLLNTSKNNDQRGKRSSTSIPSKDGTASQSEHLKSFFDSLPRLPSHYCRSTSSKFYLEPIYKSKSHLYEVYKIFCNDEKIKPVSNCLFFRQFDEQNLSLYMPKKDKCDVCCAFETKNINEDEYNKHIQRKILAREEKNADKQRAMEGKITCLTMDVQSVKICPKLNASALYYKTKLCCHNFTIYNLANHEVVCYWWNECEGELRASNFVSCLVDFIQVNVPKNIPLVIYSDGCTYQNRNVVMSNALLEFAVRNKMNISQKYLEKGHTQMECDSVHSVIERKLKNTDIYLPHEYVKLTKEAKSKEPKYVAKYLSYDFFKDYSKNHRYPSIRPGKKSGDATVTQLREIFYNPNGTIQYKLGFEEDLQELPTRPKSVNVSTIPEPMYVNQLPLKESKWNDLQALKAVLPQDCHAFYEKLPKI